MPTHKPMHVAGRDRVADRLNATYAGVITLLSGRRGAAHTILNAASISQ
jgi:hypothetical protein